MTSAFTVVINVAKLNLIATPPCSSYHVFVDPSQMGIVLEFMELVRYLWDLKHSIIITYNNAHIHYLEDIRILSLFKHVEVECFTPSPSERIRIKSLLEQLKFFDSSTGQNIPRIIFSRFEKNANKETEIGVLTKLSNFKSNENNVQERIDCHEAEQTPSRINSHDERSKSLALVQYTNHSNFVADGKTLVNKNEQSIANLINYAAASPKIQNNEALNESCPGNTTSKLTNISPAKPRGKRPQNLKPFSLGAMLNALRSSPSQEENLAPHNEVNNKQNDLDKGNENELQDEEDSSINNNIPCKKRKRVRRHRKRKQNETNFTPSNLNSNSENVQNYNFATSVQVASTSNGSHVRFDSESDEYEESFETGKSINASYEATEEANDAKKKADGEVETEGVICRLPWSKLDSSKEEETSVHKMDDEPSINNSNTTDYTKNLNNQIEEESNSLQVDPIRALLSFKKQNVSPVAYRNTQPSLMKSVNGSPRIKQEEKSN